MVIEVQKLNIQKKYSGVIEFSYDAPSELIFVPYVKFKEVKVNISYWILEDDTVEVKGNVKFVLQGKCSRCLKETQSSYDAEIDTYYVPQGKTGEDEDYYYSNGVLNLDECINDAIMLNMPFSLLCDENCEGIEW